MDNVAYLRWSPADSPVSVEFPPDLPAKLAADARKQESRGLLSGVAGRSHVQILREADSASRSAVAMFSVRPRGLVFLTEADLEFMEQSEVSTALVIAGDRAGVFVKASDGTLQSFISPEEFTIADVQPEPAASLPSDPQPQPAKSWRWAACFALLIGIAPVVPASRVYVPGLRSSRSLNVYQESGVIEVNWDPGWPATLSITDGDRRVTTEVSPLQSKLLYILRGNDVDIRLTTRGHAEATKFIVAPH